MERVDIAPVWELYVDSCSGVLRQDGAREVEDGKFGELRVQGKSEGELRGVDLAIYGHNVC